MIPAKPKNINIHNETILAADDNPADRFLLQKAFDELGQSHNLTIAKNGEELINNLKNIYAETKRLPLMILLDLNMPKMNGIEALRLIREDPVFKVIPIMIISNSGKEENVYKAYKSGANSFIVKPLEYEVLLNHLRTIEEYWFNVASLPPNG